jgi:heptaprenyl diphosphate synthase
MLSYVEGIIPINAVLPFPGFKLGLANLAVLYAFFTIGITAACCVSICRITLSALLFGSVTSFAFSLAGGLLTLGALAFYKLYLHKINGIMGLSVLCAALHNIGQCLVCAVLFGHYVLTFYLPYLLFFSLITGSITGFLASKYPKLKIFKRLT